LNPLEIKKGFANAFDSSLNHQKFDFVLFDNCLMANAETFCSIYPYTKQVIANEREGKLHAEYKLSCSFDYASLLELLSQQSALANSLIGKYIVDRYAM
jgi:hypothetical protein